MQTGTVESFDIRLGTGRILPDGPHEPGETVIAVSVDTKAVDRAGISSVRPGQRLGFRLVTDRFNRGHAVDLCLVRSPSRRPVECF